MDAKVTQDLLFILGLESRRYRTTASIAASVLKGQGGTSGYPGMGSMESWAWCMETWEQEKKDDRWSANRYNIYLNTDTDLQHIGNGRTGLSSFHKRVIL